MIASIVQIIPEAQSIPFRHFGEAGLLSKVHAPVHALLRIFGPHFDWLPFDGSDDIVIRISGARKLRPAFTHSLDRFPLVGCLRRHASEQILEYVR